MDGEHLKNDEGYIQLCELRAGALKDLERLSRETREQIKDLAISGNRCTRRKANRAMSMANAYDKEIRAKVDALFAKFLGRYDPEAGTASEVQEEAAAAFAAIFATSS